MNLGSIIFIIAAIGSITAACGMALYVSRLLDKLDGMLEAAISGTYEESRYDESRISKLEAKLSRFLSASSLSRKRLIQDYDNIAQTVSDMSHQTKTPIANIMLYTQLLHEITEDSKERELVERIGSQADKLNFLVQSLVKISRLENDIVAVNPAKQEVHGLLKDLQETYRKKAEKKGIGLVAEDAGCLAYFDYKWTKEALGNIVDNAIKYTGAGGKIRISAKQYELFTVIEITDNGIGIAEEEQAKIFLRFYRSMEVNQYDGVGIGLYLARKIVTMEGGYIKVVSERQKGSSFFVYLKHSIDNDNFCGLQ